MNEFERTIPREFFEQISLKDAKQVMERGLRYYVGDSYKWLPCYEGVVNWLNDNERKGLLVFGGNGLGKSLICRKIIPVIFYYHLKKEYFVADAIDLGDYFKNAIDNYRIIRSDCPLFIDDFGVESIINEYGEKHDLFSEIVDRSEKNGRLLILTTNLTPEEIGERYGLRTLDRLRAITKAVKFEGKSMRNMQ